MIRNERNRINQRCSSTHTKVIHNKDFDEILRVNGYPQQMIKSLDQNPNHPKICPNHDTEWLYLQIPYVSNAIDNKIKCLFHKEGLHVGIVHRPSTLRQALRLWKKPAGCGKHNCPINELQKPF